MTEMRSHMFVTCFNYTTIQNYIRAIYCYFAALKRVCVYSLNTFIVAFLPCEFLTATPMLTIL